MPVLPIPMLLLSLLSMGSPWWEDYGITEKFLCPNERAVTLERNDAQASLIACFGKTQTCLACATAMNR
jgi:hypothetical protein